MFKLFADTDCDITLRMAKEHNLGLISMPYSIGDETIFPYEDYEEFDSKTFYDMLRAGTIPTTSGLNKEKYLSYFEPVLASGMDILYLHFSRKMTMTFDTMDEALEELKVKYPDRTVYTVDTKGITVISYNLIMEAIDMAESGKSLEEIHAAITGEVDHFAQYFFADDLKFFKRSGRVSGLAATMGTLLGVRPIIYINDEGKMVSIGKERGREKAIERLVSYVEELGDDVKAHRVVIGHTDAGEVAAEVEKRLKERFGDDLNVVTVLVNPTAGAHCGPNGVGVSFHAIHR
ncbi:MAG: DegV family protein [Clostridia bacterium]|nr:DegV family protein [Clostridia bacterium]